MDVLSEVLRAVKLDGALFYNAEFSAPWAARSIDAHTVTSSLSPNSQHVIIFHLLTEGRGYAHVEGGMSGSPILMENGCAIGVVSTGSGPEPRLMRCLPGWLLDGVKEMKRGRGTS